MRTLLKYLASYMTFFLKFLHLGKHKHFPCVLVSKFLMSNPKNVNLESEVKYLPCQLTYTSNPFSIMFVSGSTAKYWALMATPRLVVCFGVFFNSCGVFSPIFRVTPTGLQSLQFQNEVNRNKATLWSLHSGPRMM